MCRRSFLALVVSLGLITSPVLAQSSGTSGGAPGVTTKAPMKKNRDISQQEQRVPLSPEELNAQKDLEALRSKPEEFRVLVLGIQIFLGRFGYGTGPYSGKLDERTRRALGEYQQYVNLPKTGDIDIRTLHSLTADNRALDQLVPYLPPATFEFKQWDTAIQVQGTWVRKDAPTTDSVHTSKISCFRDQNQCIEATAILLNKTTPVLEVLTDVHTIKEWDEDKLVTEAYDGEPCTVSILRIIRKEKTVFRFTAYQQGKGVCAQVHTEDVQYQLVNGPEVYGHLKQRKAEEIKRILRVKE